MEERDYFLAFSLSPGIGPKTFNLLINDFGSAEKAWNAKEEELLPILKLALTAKFLSFRQVFNFTKYKEQFRKQKISFVTLGEDDYPKLLKQIPNPPIVLYMKGNFSLLGSLKKSKVIAIVGTRRITTYGRQITEMFARELAGLGFVIVSGMALGVDAVSHKATIDAKGKTIAVLGNGVDLPYPYENQQLYEEILDNGGLIISEFPPGMPPSVGSFPSRNRIVAGLSEGILVTEGASDSGSLITANFGLDFGRKVFAVPGPITSLLSKAPLDLIAKGARLVTSTEDILKEFSIFNPQILKQNGKSVFKTSDKNELKILKLLENEPFSFDEISRRTKINPSNLGGILSLMEIKNFIKNSDGKFFIGS